MTDQQQADDRPARSSWAWLMFDGPVALFLVLCGVYFIIGQRDEWSDQSEQFRAECTQQSELETQSATLISTNGELRDAFSLLNDHPHVYALPAAQTVNERVAYGC